jgi:hypothetical protein
MKRNQPLPRRKKPLERNLKSKKKKSYYGSRKEQSPDTATHFDPFEGEPYMCQITRELGDLGEAVRTGTMDYIILNTRHYGRRLKQWYIERIKEATGCCAECGEPINYMVPEVALGSQAHILPKAQFPTIALHPMNNNELGRWCCHGQYDASWEKASRMKVWDRSKLTMFTHLLHLLPRDEYRRVPDFIREEYESTVFSQQRGKEGQHFASSIKNL